MTILLWILLCIVLLCLLFFIFISGCVHTVFGKRCDENPQLRYKTEKDFSRLKAEPVSFSSGKNTLSGAWYHVLPQDQCKAIVLFIHGMGAGHHSYTTEIHTLAQAGFLVLSYDQTGCAASTGKNIRSFYQGVRDLDAALRFIGSDPEKSCLPMGILGHSWGGYIACQAPSLESASRIQAIAALSPVNDPGELITAQIAAKIKLPRQLILPFVKAVLFLLDGSAALLPCSQILLAHQVPALIYHGDQDTMVPLSFSPVSAPDIQAAPPIQTRICPGRSHNVYQSKRSEDYLNKTFAQIGIAWDQLKKTREKEKAADASGHLQQLYRQVDYDLITEEDPAVMTEITDFLHAHTA